jgi:Tol biopolymer transport system component
MIAPVRDGPGGKELEWIAVTDGTHNDSGPQFSPDGNTAYFISQRDGYDCIGAQRLEPATKRPVNEAFGYEYFRDASQKDLDGFWGGDGDLSIARDKIIVSLSSGMSDLDGSRNPGENRGENRVLTGRNLQEDRNHQQIGDPLHLDRS